MGVDQRRLTELSTREAIAFVEANRDRSFFLYLAHTMPHVPHFPERDAPSPHEYLYFFSPLGGGDVGAVRDARFKYLLSTGDLGRDRPHLSSLEHDQEQHDLRHRFPEDAARLREELDTMQRQLDRNPRGWRS